MAEQAHARFYRDLPPVVRHPGRRWLMLGALAVLAGIAIAVPVYALVYATHSVPSAWFGGAGRSVGGNGGPLLIWSSVAWIGGAFVTGGLLGFALARTWWSTLACDAAGFFALLVLGASSSSPAGAIFASFFWIFGVSAGVGIRGLKQRGRLRAALLPTEISLLVVMFVSAAGIASFEERRPRWPGYQGSNESFYFGVTPWWAYVAAVVLGLLAFALAVLIYRARPRGI